jgi:hypothetical protein
MRKEGGVSHFRILTEEESDKELPGNPTGSEKTDISTQASFKVKKDGLGCSSG